MNRTGHELALALPRAILLLLWPWLFAPILCVSASSNGIIPYSVRIWQADDGLPQNSVYAIAQTADGYLWVGTHEGLTRFNGIRFTLVDDATVPELKRGWITALAAGSDGSLWIACDGAGVIHLKNGVFSRLSETNGLPSNQPRCLMEARDGSLWIGTETAGVTCYKN